jgi:hypothetical protein
MATPIAVPGTRVQYVATGPINQAAVIVSLTTGTVDYTQPLQLITFTVVAGTPTMTAVVATYSDAGEVGTWHFLPLPI